MSLTSPWFLALVTMMLAAAFVTLVKTWARWAGPGHRAALFRAGLLAGVNALVLLTAAVGLNLQFQFFADWSDLAAATGIAGAGGSSSGHVGGDARSAVVRPSGRVTPVKHLVLPPLPRQLRPGARTARFTVRGAHSGITADVVVYLPAGYTDPAQGSRRYPVLEGFPGYPGGPLMIAGEVAQVVRRHQLADPIILSPVTQVPTGRDTECVDGGVADPRVETWLTVDVPEWAEQTLRVQPDRNSWATVGWSAGGWCSAMAAMLHPDRYGAGIVLGGYFRPYFGAQYRPFTTNSPQGRRYDLVALAGKRPPSVALWIQTSKADTLSYPTTAQFLARVRAPLSVQSLIQTNTGHRVAVWQAVLPQALTWLGRTAPGFAPGASGGFGPGASTGNSPVLQALAPVPAR